MWCRVWGLACEEGSVPNRASEGQITASGFTVEEV